jgi:phage terminase small subunit
VICQKDIKRELMENTDLNKKQKLFCVAYSKCLNATKAYQKVYKCSYETAMVRGCGMLRNVQINAFVDKLTDITFNKEFVKKSIIQKYTDIAFADMHDFVDFGSEEVERISTRTGKVMLDKNGKALTHTINFSNFKNTKEVDGTLVSEVSTGKDGVKVKLHDKIKALEWLSARLDLLPTETAARLDLEREKLKLSSGDITGEVTEDDGFITALKSNVGETWNESEDD